MSMLSERNNKFLYKALYNIAIHIENKTLYNALYNVVIRGYIIFSMKREIFIFFGEKYSVENKPIL